MMQISSLTISYLLTGKKPCIPSETKGEKVDV